MCMSQMCAYLLEIEQKDTRWKSIDERRQLKIESYPIRERERLISCRVLRRMRVMLLETELDTATV